MLTEEQVRQLPSKKLNQMANGISISRPSDYENKVRQWVREERERRGLK